MKKQFSLLAPGLLLVAFALTLAACGATAPAASAPTARSATTAPATVAPTGAPVEPTVAPASATPEPSTQTSVPTAPPPTDTPASSGSNATVSAQSGYDGQWEGKSSTDSPIQFTIENNQVTNLLVNYAYQSGSCSVGGGYGDMPVNSPINGKDLAARITDSDGVQYSITGSFTSGAEAAGTLEVKGKTFCGDTDAKATWTAKNTSTAAASGDNVTPTEVAQEASPTAESGDGDPTNVLAMFFISVDTKQIDDAMALVSDDVVFQIGSTSGIGKDQLKAYLQDQVNQGVDYEGSNISATGNIVNFTVQVMQAAGGTPVTYSNSSVIVENGKISILSLK